MRKGRRRVGAVGYGRAVSRPAQPVRPTEIGDRRALEREPLLAARRRRLRLRAAVPFVALGRILWRHHGHLVSAGFALSLAGSTAVAASAAVADPSDTLALLNRHRHGAISATAPGAQFVDGDMRPMLEILRSDGGSREG